MSSHSPMPLTKRRFAICKACEHSREGSFKCELRKGCCFGRFRPLAHALLLEMALVLRPTNKVGQVFLPIGLIEPLTRQGDRLCQRRSILLN